MNVYSWRELNAKVDSLIKSVKESEFKDEAFIDIIAGRIADITLVLGETGYNLFDKTFDKRFINTWAQVLMLSAMNNEFMNNKLVEMLLLHNVGGIFTNLIMDSSTRLLPLSPKEIDKTLSSLKINQLLTGYRGKRFVDRKMLIQNIIKLIEFSINPINKVHLLEINPLFVYEDKVTAVDAVIWKF